VAGVLTVVFAWSASTRHTGGTRLCCTPHITLPSYSFLILDMRTRGSSSDHQDLLNSPSSPKDVRFEGERLIYRAVGRPHLKQTFPAGIYIEWRRTCRIWIAVLELKDGDVQVNGLDLCRREIVVSRSGESWQGMLRIAH